MAIPKKIERLLNDRLSLIDDSIDNMDVQDVQEKTFNELRRYIYKNFDTDKEGSIKKTVKNLKKAQEFKKLRSIILNDSYKEKVSKFLKSFDKVRKLSDDYIIEL